MRLFFALPLPEALLAGMAEWQRKAREAGLAAAYPRVEGLHLTLVFLGAVDPARLLDLGSAASAVASAVEAFPLRTSGLDAFPGQGAPKVIWLGLDASAPLNRLQDALAGALAPLDFPKDERPFAPHLTLARPKGRPPTLPAAPSRFEWTASELALYESVAAVGGRRYEVKGRWPLSGSLPPR